MLQIVKLVVLQMFAKHAFLLSYFPIMLVLVLLVKFKVVTRVLHAQFLIALLVHQQQLVRFVPHLGLLTLIKLLVFVDKEELYLEVIVYAFQIMLSIIMYAIYALLLIVLLVVKIMFVKHVIILLF